MATENVAWFLELHLINYMTRKDYRGHLVFMSIGENLVRDVIKRAALVNQ